MVTKQNIGKEALTFHKKYPAGKIGTRLTKPLNGQNDLSLAYTPGVAEPCKEIEKNHRAAFDYTAKGNLVAVVTNGTAVLGLGNLGALASKPVMEGKAALFKRFAGIDAVDIEVETEEVDKFINSVKYLGASWGGINLEDIKAPECFIIEKELIKRMNIPVFHDDQHGTAIVAAAAMINAFEITGRNIKSAKVVVNGAGAAAIACMNLLTSLGMPLQNITMCDSRGVIYKGRTAGMNEWKIEYASDTKVRSLAEAVEGADAFVGVSVKNVLSADMVKTMSSNPIIFAMANPDPEILPDVAHGAVDDAVVATGRSDFPNQINNLLGFPYIFRGALDVCATEINNEMKIAAAYAIAALAKEPVPDVVKSIYNRDDMVFGKNYIIPTPFDPRLLETIPLAVAKAAMDSGVATKKVDLNEYKELLAKLLVEINS